MNKAITTISKPPKKAFRVLVVDDNLSDIELTTIQLGQAWPFEHDMAVESVASGKEALARLQRERFALLILDWQMPEVNGREILHHVRKTGARMAVIVLSGVDRDDIADNLESHGAAYLNKNEMNHKSLHDAIATSLRLLGHLPAA